MRCADVIEELGVSTGPDSPAIADHLAHCPRCAAWARRDARLTQLWEATRPDEPRAEAWESVWSGVTESLEAVPAGATITLPARTWERWTWTALGLAQVAAMLLVAIWLGSQPAPAIASTPKVDLEWGAPGWIRIDGEQVKVVRLDTDESSSAAATLHVGPVDPTFVMLDYFEAMAN
jgi:hypothetical protein